MDIMGQVIDMDEDERDLSSRTGLPQRLVGDGIGTESDFDSDDVEFDFGLDGVVRPFASGARGFSKRIVGDYFTQADDTIDSMRQAL
jgi:hypothetical protein